MFTKARLKDYNFKLLFNVLLLLGIGSIFVYSADHSYLVREITGIILGLIVMIFLSFVEYDFICKFSRVIYIGTIIVMLSVLVLGQNVNGATRWISIGGAGGVQFQPSEFSKIAMILFAATHLDKHKSRGTINTAPCLTYFIVTVGIYLLTIFLEPDLSTTVCITLILLTMLYVSGLSYKIIGLTLLIMVPVVGSFLWYIQQPFQHLLKEYQVGRILQFIYPEKYAEDFSQQSNSIMAIGSGQLTGKGLSTSTIATVKDANFISEQQTDFIFSVIGEEVGFIGSVIIIAIILVLVLQCIRIGRQAKDTKGMLIATGMGCWIGYQSFINIAVASGIGPNTGMPLPFISYGQSSLLSLSIGIGILLNVSIHRTRY